MHSLIQKKIFAVIGEKQNLSAMGLSQRVTLKLFLYFVNHSLKPITRIDVCIATRYSISEN